MRDRERKYPMRYVKKTDPDYPPALLRYERMPAGLYVIGSLPDPGKKSVAVVGSRNCTSYGKQQALRFARALAGRDVQIISGLALGIDSWSHIGALEEHGKTYAVLGCGADVCYPASHAELYDRILETGGGILSEYEPGTPPLSHHFPVRNRIISALADIVLVIEARKRSGSLITVSYALDQGKNIFAVPGRNGDRLSEGCNRMIADGAGIAREPGIILQELGYADENDGEKRKRRALPETLRKDHAVLRVFSCLSSEERDLGDLAEETGLSVPEITRALVRLQLEGYVLEGAGYGFIRSDP